MWISREIEPEIEKVAGTRPALIVTGCRQAGKTSLMRKVFPEVKYVSLDLPSVAEKAEHSGRAFLEEYPPPVVLDEVQYAPALLRNIKREIDDHRDENGRFLISGSQKFSLMQGVSESLAGRAAVLELHSLSAREFEAWAGTKLDQASLVDWIVRGGYPELLAKDLDPGRFYSDYLSTYIERDVRSVLQVRSLRDFDRFLRLCATRTAQLLSLNSLASDVGVSPNTIKSWLSVLEASTVITLLEPYYANLGKRIVKTPKLYFLDTGLACFLLGIRRREDLLQSPMLGSLFETHVLGQLVRHFANRGVEQPLYFYRDHHGHEVDFLIPSGSRFSLIECKWSETPSASQHGIEEVRRLVGDDRIISATVVTPYRDERTLPGGLVVADSVSLGFLQTSQTS